MQGIQSVARAIARSIVRVGVGGACTALLGVLGAPAAVAQQPLDLSNGTARPVQVEVLGSMLDESGAVLAGAFGPARPADLDSSGALVMVAVRSADVMPTLPELPSVSVSGARVELSEAQFSEVTDLVAMIDRSSGGSRVSLSTSGTIDLTVRVLGIRIAQTLNFRTATFAATDLGPIFVGRGIAGGGGLEGAAAAIGDGPVTVPGPGMACAMPGSRFLSMGMGIPECAPETFADLVQMDPTPFDAQTGELRAVGVQMITIEPFMVAGVRVEIAPVPLFDVSTSVLRLTER